MIRADVSVVIPVHDGELFLGEALDSVRSQTRLPAQIIVVDDASTDGTARIAASYPEVTCHRLEGPATGPARGRNLAIAEAKGEFVAFLDVDDLWEPGKTESQLEVFSRNRDVDYVMSHQALFCHEGMPMPRWVAETQRTPHVGFLSTMLIRREALVRVGDFDAAYRIADDVDWFARARRANLTCVALDDVLVRKRIHAANISANAKLNSQELLKIFRAAVREKRISG